MRHWEKQIAQITRRIIQFLWYLFDVNAVLIIASIPIDGLLESASMASGSLLGACLLILFRWANDAA